MFFSVSEDDGDGKKTEREFKVDHVYDDDIVEQDIITPVKMPLEQDLESVEMIL